MSDSNKLQSISSNCPHNRSLLIYKLNYDASPAADADPTAFAEKKCPQLEKTEPTLSTAYCPGHPELPQ